MESNCLRPELLTLHFTSNKILFTVVTTGVLKLEKYFNTLPFLINVDTYTIPVHYSNEKQTKKIV